MREIIWKGLPSLTVNLMDTLIERLELIGVTSLDDLHFIKFEDVVGILPPIQCRRLIQACSEGKYHPIFNN